MVLDVDAAVAELNQKSLLDIERATARTWGGRAAAAFRLAAQADGEARTKWLMDGENYRQEALEHAAMTEDLDLLVAIRDAVDAERP